MGSTHTAVITKNCYPHDIIIKREEWKNKTKYLYGRIED